MGYTFQTIFSEALRFLTLLLVLLGGGESNAQTLFTRVPAEVSGVDFVNKIVEDDSLHIFRYEYLYNGNGVGVGDFDGDGAPDLFISGNTVPHKLYLNRSTKKSGGIGFEDVTRQAGVAGNGTWGTGVSVADVNGDGRLDVYVCHSGFFRDNTQLSNELFINQGLKNGVPVFKEMAREMGLDGPGTHSTQAAFFDYDRDGDLDMFLLNHSNHTVNPLLNTRAVRATPNPYFGNRLFRNDNGKFTDVTAGSGIINNALNFGLSVTVADINQDGWPDLYTSSDYTEVDCYYVNNRDGRDGGPTFTESLRRSFAHISKFSMGADVADFNNDGRPDVLTLDMLPEDNRRQKLLKGPDLYDQYHMLLDSGYYHQQMRNMLQMNVGVDARQQVRFSEVGQLAGISNTDWSWAGLMADFDNDGWKDILVTNGYLRDFTNMDFLKYTVAEAQLKEAAKGNLRFQTYGLVQKMPANKLRNYVFRNKGETVEVGFEDVSKKWGLTEATVSNAAAYADFDGDGDLDLVISNVNEPVFIYQNNSNNNNYLTLRLAGSAPNTLALGSKVWLYTEGQSQYQEVYPVRGYQSSVSTDMHFGFGKSARPDSVVIVWPTGHETRLISPQANQLLVVEEEMAPLNLVKSVVPEQAQPTIFQQLTSEQTGLDFVHQENDFVDFKVEVLLPYQLSRMGPALARGDVNGDGREDLFFGGAINQFGVLYLQTADGKFAAATAQPWRAQVTSEEVAAHFFDADGDGNLDMYLASGGNEYEENSPEYQDHLYLNQGDGSFQYAPNVLPIMLSPSQCITSADVDGDGDLDLFIGGRAIPGSFPVAARSYLLRNDSQNGVVVFADATNEWSPDLLTPGMITGAVLADLDGDGRSDLALAGDWMGIRVFKNTSNHFEEIRDQGLEQTEGMWASLALADLDGDGDLDLVAGNCGLNNQYKASSAKPMRLYYDDFDDNGLVDPIFTYYIGDKSYPMFSRDEMLDQMVPLRRKYLSYDAYADATIEDVFGKDKVEKANKLICTELASLVFENKGNFTFVRHELPQSAQMSRVSGIVVEDVDADGRADLIVAGNFSPYRVQLGPADASFGQLFMQNKPWQFKTINPEKSGLWADGDVRGLTLVEVAEYKWLVVGRNDQGTLVFRIGHAK